MLALFFLFFCINYKTLIFYVIQKKALPLMQTCQSQHLFLSAGQLAPTKTRRKTARSRFIRQLATDWYKHIMIN